MLDVDGIATALAREGWWTDAAALDRSLCAALLTDLRTLDAAQDLEPAGVGRAATYRRDPNVRGDRIGWLRSTTPAQRSFLEELDALRISLNRTLYLGLTGIEAHFAQYDVGSRYRTHVDTFVGVASRTVSLVVYLNDDWRAADGGELVLYGKDATTELARIAPRAGTVVIFMSEELPHAVLPARRPRASIAAWLRRRSN